MKRLSKNVYGLKNKVVVCLTLCLLLFSIGCVQKVTKPPVRGQWEHIPKERILKPIDFDTKFIPDLPYDEIVIIIKNVRGASKNDHHYENFSTSLNDILLKILEYTSKRFNISSEGSERIIRNYNMQYPQIADEMFQSLQFLLNTPEFLPKKGEILEYPATTAVTAFGELLSEKICILVDMLLTLSKVNTVVSKALPILTRPCEILIAEAVNPILEEMKNRALLKDHLRLNVTFKKHIRKMIAELVTVQDEFEVTFETDVQRVILKFFKSTADMKVEVIGIVKAGFDLNKIFSIKIDDLNRKIDIVLSEPKIVSTELDFNIVHINDGWFIKIDEKVVNEVLRIVKQRIQERALNSRLFSAAKENAVMIIKSFFAPVSIIAGGEYEINVSFRSDSEQIKQIKDKFRE